MQFKSEEITAIVNDFNEPGSLAPTGLHLAGTKYMVIQGEAGAVIRGKKVINKNLLSILNTVISLHGDKFQYYNGIWSNTHKFEYFFVNIINVTNMIECIIGIRWCNCKENKPSSDIRYLWWTYGSWSVQHGRREDGWLPHWSRPLDCQWIHVSFSSVRDSINYLFFSQFQSLQFCMTINWCYLHFVSPNNFGVLAHFDPFLMFFNIHGPLLSAEWHVYASLFCQFCNLLNINLLIYLFVYFKVYLFYKA